MNHAAWFALTLIITGGVCDAQSGPAMRTRDITRLSQFEIAKYLKRNDSIFVPVGSVEGNGASPSDRDYASALAVAMKMAEAADALFAPNLSYFYAGSTITSEATVNVSLSESREYLKQLAKSFLRQGFRTQVWVVSGHGPAPLFVGSMVREFFDETHVPILAIDAADIARKQNRDREKMAYGTYSLLNRLDDMPLAKDVPNIPMKPGGVAADNPGLATLSKMGYSGSLTLGFWWADPNGHGYSNTNLPTTPEERAAWGKQGEAEIDALVQGMHVPAMLTALKGHAKFTEDEIVSKYKAMLP
ncbi:MAG TPA: creatininase family protein [Bryobacteraceae bacterium]|nr:creatininase family protein [Bryobacteraceae bacterium]